ncbi:MAG: recombinase RecB [Candidatus Nezhaarchaeales archaeon]
MRRGLSSERVAIGILERMGFKVLDTRKKIIKDGVEVGEVDIVASSPEGELYAVEVKAGKASVSDIRQAYTGALLLGMKPLIICKSFADAAAETVAKELNVKVLTIPEYYMLFEVEDLELAVKAALQDSIDEFGPPIPLPHGEKLTKRDLKLLKTIASSNNIEEVASKLKISIQDVWRHINNLRARGILRGSWGFERLKIHVRRVLAYIAFEEKLKNMDRRLRRIEKLIEDIKRKMES